MTNQNYLSNVGRRPRAIMLLGMLLIAGWASAEDAMKASDADPLQPVAAMLTQSVLLTRGDAGVEDEAIRSHVADTHQALAKMLSQTASHRPVPYEDDVHLHADMGEIVSLSEMARHFLDHGDKHSAHHAMKGIRLMIAEIRSRNGIVAFGDCLWRYNCAFHPMMHEIMHHSGEEQLTGEQMVILKRSVRNATLALAALHALAEAETSARGNERLVLVRGCRTSLEKLSDVLKNTEDGARTETMAPLVKAVRRAFIELATYESETKR